jgi:hypothetical protein
MQKHVFDHAGRPVEREIPKWQRPAPVRRRTSKPKRRSFIRRLLGV